MCRVKVFSAGLAFAAALVVLFWTARAQELQAGHRLDRGFFNGQEVCCDCTCDELDGEPPNIGCCGEPIPFEA